MADNSSELDQITHEAGHLGRQVLQVISTWRLMNPKATTVPRPVRREINRLLKADAQEREFAHAQERLQIERQVLEYRWKSLTRREIRPWDTTDAWFERQRQLAADYHDLQDRIHVTTNHLTATERGQASRALTMASLDPAAVTTVFGRPRGLEALRARLHDGFTRLRAGLASPTQTTRIQQWQQQRSQRATPQRHRIDPLDPLSRLDPDQPINLIPADKPTPPGQPATGQPRRPRTDNGRSTSGTDTDAKTRANALHRNGYSWGKVAETLGLDRDQLADLLFTDEGLPEVPIDPGEPTEVVHRRGVPSGYHVYVISDPDGTGTDSKTDHKTVSAGPIEAVSWAQEQLGEHGGQVKVLVYPAGPGYEYNPGPPVYSVEGRTDVIAAQLRDDVTGWKMTSPQLGDLTDPTPDQPAPQQDSAHTRGASQSGTGQTEVEHERGYRVAVGTAEFAAKHPDMVEHADVATLTAGYTWALDQLSDDHKGWPTDGDVVVHIHDQAQKPIHTLAGPRGMAIDEVIGWQEHHEHSPLAQIEALQTELQAARAEVDQLRTENTDLVRKFAEHSPTESGPTAPVMPTGPRLAQPIFAAPVINQPILNGLDR